MHITRWTRWALALVSIMLLVSCGGTSGLSPEQVHQQFLTAVQANDRQAVMNLVADDLMNKTARVDRWLQEMQTELNPPPDLGMSSTGGGLHDQEILPIVMQGAGAQGFSRWPYADRTICHVATLAQTPQGWRVTSWGESTSGCDT